jgi:hypothetical protein
MNTHTALLLSFDPAKNQRRAVALKQRGFEVVSVSSPVQARYEIEMGRCGIFITCPLIADIVSLDLLGLFKKFCPSGITVAVTNSRTRATIGPHVDIAIDEAGDPDELVSALTTRLPKAQPDLGAA